jgi:hypothetical protein
MNVTVCCVFSVLGFVLDVTKLFFINDNLRFVSVKSIQSHLLLGIFGLIFLWTHGICRYVANKQGFA